MANQKANSVYLGDGVTLDDLMVVYGRILDNVQANFQYRSFLNTEYIDEPVRGGTVKVRKFKNPTSQAYGTARAAREANKLIKNEAEIKVDTDREITEELNGKDKILYTEEGGVALLTAREQAYANAMGLELETAYYTKLQQTAVANGLVNLSAGATTKAKLAILIRALESKTVDGYINGVNRADMVLSLAPQWFDDLEDEIATLPNPRNGGANAQFFHGVEIIPAIRQGFDAVVQYRGAMAQPVALDDFKVDGIELSNDIYAYMSYYFGTGAVLPDLVLAGALDSGISA